MNSQGKSTLFLEGESQPQRDIILIRGNHFITRQYLSSKRPPGLIHMCGKIAVTILFEQTHPFLCQGNISSHIVTKDSACSIASGVPQTGFTFYFERSPPNLDILPPYFKRLFVLSNHLSQPWQRGNGKE